MVNDLGHDQVLESTPFPRPGEPNPLVAVGIAPAAGGPAVWADLSAYDGGAFLVTGAGWTPAGREAWIYVQDRCQTWLDLLLVDAPASGRTRRLLREAGTAWVDPPPSPPLFLEDGGFVFSSERTDGAIDPRHDREGRLQGAVTSGEWEVRSVERFDRDPGWLYFTAAHPGPVAEQLFRVRLDGSGRELHPGGRPPLGLPSPTGGMFIDTWSSHSAPARVALRRADGALLLNFLDVATRCRPWASTGWPATRLLTIPARDGFPLQAAMALPPDFDPSRPHRCVVLHLRLPPHPDRLRRLGRRGGSGTRRSPPRASTSLHFDPRTAVNGRGDATAWLAYRRLGQRELQDGEDVARWLAREPGVDAARIGVNGTSYGGYYTLYLITR